jgi:hypothetical protein
MDQAAAEISMFGSADWLPHCSFSNHIPSQGIRAMDSPDRAGVWDRFLEACRREGVQEGKMWPDDSKSSRRKFSEKNAFSGA